MLGVWSKRIAVQYALLSLQNKEGIKGHFWFLEADLREGQLVKLDKSGKAMLTLLRHLGRLQEVRRGRGPRGAAVTLAAG